MTQHDGIDVRYSDEDMSVNFVRRVDGGAFESRFVRRSDDYFICYLSSHTGCNKACRMCHLTATGQTKMDAADIDELGSQAGVVFKHYRAQVDSGLQVPAQTVHFNFMARGEPLDSPVLTKEASTLYDRLGVIAAASGVPEWRVKVSTIMPLTFDATIEECFGAVADRTDIFYSLYTMDPDVRRRWLPKAMPVEVALDKLSSWQTVTGAPVTLHWTLIKNVNDSVYDIDNIANAVRERGLFGKMNVVRYNPTLGSRFPDEAAEEMLQYARDTMSQALQDTAGLSRVVPRVGFDVKASCGMFV